MYLLQGVVWQVAYHRLHGVFGFGIERAIGQVMGVEVGFDGLQIRHAPRDDSCSVSSATELKVFFDKQFALAFALG
jgi:hypothetical protein